MKIIIIIIVEVLAGAFNAQGQSNLTKSEIINVWLSKTRIYNTFEDSGNATFSPSVSNEITFFIDSLKKSGIDNFIVYTEAYPGYVSLNPCNDYIYPIYGYLLWTTDNYLAIKSIKGRCQSFATTIDSLNIFDFFRDNKDEIQNEIVMPVILSTAGSGKNLTYTMSIIDHEPIYSLYLVSDNTFKTVNFTENDLLNENSLFHEHNATLKAIQLWKIIDRRIKSMRD